MDRNRLRSIGPRRVGLLLALIGTVAAVAATAAPASAAGGLFFNGAPGTSAPPPFLGPCVMYPFPADATAPGTGVTTATDLFGGVVTFNSTLGHQKIGFGWLTWSHGYLGDVYTQYTFGTVPGEDFNYAVTLTMPGAGVRAFYLYAESNAFGTFPVRVSATSSTGARAYGSASVTGFAGAKYFGFYTTAGSGSVTRVTVVFPRSAGGFAIGEFADSNACNP